MPANRDLREFLSALGQQGQLLSITDQVHAEPDLGAAACALTRLGDASPAIHFNNIAGYTGARVAMNVHGSWRNHALALGLDKSATPREQFDRFVEGYQLLSGRLPARHRPRRRREVVVEKEINLFGLMHVPPQPWPTRPLHRQAMRRQP